MCRYRYWNVFCIVFCVIGMVIGSEHTKKIRNNKMIMGSSAWLPGTWGEWSSWSPCSTTCGRGVSTQSRECISGERRWSQFRTKGASDSRTPSRGRCLGIYKRFVICNEKPCLKEDDMRRLQCSSYNNKSFRGVKYRWEPYLRDLEDCQLNCRPVGHKFYVTLSKSVEDGTPCGINHSKICAAGQCKNISCDGVVGSDTKFDQCGVCGGDNSTCKIVSGLYTRPTLPVGYNLIAKIPSSACNINITELQPSSNYLALRTSNGTYIINGNWAINWSGDYLAAGTTFSYKRHDSQTNQLGESIFAKGPVTEGIDLLLIYQQPNSGIKYEYILPVYNGRNRNTRVNTVGSTPNFQLPFRDSPPIPSHGSYPPVLSDGRSYNSGTRNTVLPLNNNSNEEITNRNRPKATNKGRWSRNDVLGKNYKRFESKHSYRWKIAGLSECSQTCGGGTQRTIISCLKHQSMSVVPDFHCDPKQKPETQIVRCNTQPCPAVWVPGEWEPCSVTCGEGLQYRKLWCKQEVSPTLNMNVAEGACHSQEKMSSVRKCFIRPCVRWKVGEWGKCSAECGKGMRKREVKCVTDSGETVSPNQCSQDKKPSTDEMCDMGPCVNTWFFSQWSSMCSAECGRGHFSRKVACLHGSGKSDAEGTEGTCDPAKRPESQKPCTNEHGCEGKWFTGPWSRCSVTCGNGTQTRQVLCVKSENGVWVTKLDNNCQTLEKPTTIQICQKKLCTDEWYTGEWTECSKPCDTGVQSRQVTCVNKDLQFSSNCPEKDKPLARQACNTVECPEIKEDSGCVDNSRNCTLVVQARLCSYSYYRNLCCDSCYPYK